MGKISLMKVSGICAILAGVLGVAGIVVIMVGIPDLKGARDASAYLLILEKNKETFAIGLWLFILAPMLAIFAGLGFHQALREAGDLVSVAVVMFVIGLLFSISRSFIDLAVVYGLATGYVAADPGSATRAALEIMAGTFGILGTLVDLVGEALAAGIGVLLFSLAILRTAVAPKWIGYLGLAVALLLGWLPLLGPVLPIFKLVGLIGFFAFVVWLVSMGVVLLRQKPEGASAQPSQ